jgi:hypothetical protein
VELKEPFQRFLRRLVMQLPRAHKAQCLEKERKWDRN